MEEDFYLNLIIKRLSNAIEPEESAQLEAWEAESEANRRFVAETEEAWEAADDLRSEPKVDLDAEFSFLEAKMEEAKAPVAEPPKETPSPTRKRSPYRWLAIAASVVILLTVGLYIAQPGLFYPGTKDLPQGDLITAQATDGPETVRLPDNSTVTLRPGSTLQYPKDFAESSRSVSLEGEAFFTVEKDPKRPFTVEGKFEKITVLGTEFNVAADPSTEETTVQVVSGKVKLEPSAPGHEVVLSQGEAATWNRKTESMEKTSLAPNQIAWYTRKLVFEDAPLTEAVKAIAGQYSISLNLENKNLENCTLTATFDRQEPDEVLQVLSDIFGLEVVSVSEKNYQLNGGGC